jgi:GH15 family glucan-1,4-alpha-glucosidase
MLVGLDEHGFVHDFYYPYVGQENLTSARQVHHKIGVWVNGRFSWLDGESWSVELSYYSDALVGECRYTSLDLGLEIKIVSFVSSDEDVFSRRVYVTNTNPAVSDVRIFFHQVFQISRNGRGDTAMLVPSKTPYILTYCGDTTFISGLRTENGQHFDQYAVGNYRIEGKSGTWADAEDGELSNNNVEHGGVDSTLRACISVGPQQTTHVDYWVSASMAGYHKAAHTHRLLSVSGLENSLEHTVSYWKDWLSRSNHMSERMDDRDKQYFITSLLITKAHIDSRGGVLASADSSIYNYGLLLN